MDADGHRAMGIIPKLRAKLDPVRKAKLWNQRRRSWAQLQGLLWYWPHSACLRLHRAKIRNVVWLSSAYKDTCGDDEVVHIMVEDANRAVRELLLHDYQMIIASGASRVCSFKVYHPFSRQIIYIYEARTWNFKFTCDDNPTWVSFLPDMAAHMQSMLDFYTTMDSSLHRTNQRGLQYLRDALIDWTCALSAAFVEPSRHVLFSVMFKREHREIYLYFLQKGLGLDTTGFDWARAEETHIQHKRRSNKIKLDPDDSSDGADFLAIPAIHLAPLPRSHLQGYMRCIRFVVEQWRVSRSSGLLSVRAITYHDL